MTMNKEAQMDVQEVGPMALEKRADSAPLPATPAELTVDDILAQASKIQDVMRQAMTEGQHYGVIPGTNKPSLLQPGAEKLCLVFRLAPKYRMEREHLPDATRDWAKCRWRDGKKQAEKGTCKGFIRYAVICELVHGPTGRLVASGVGVCSNWETKYISRDPYEIEETIAQMARKRALVNAVRTGTAASDIFTQDEDLIQPPDSPRKRGKAAAAPARPAPTPSAPEPDAPAPTCPKCGGPMWDNRADRAEAEADKAAGRRTKAAPPAYKCKVKECGGVIWSNSGSDATGDAEAAKDALGDAFDKSAAPPPASEDGPDNRPATAAEKRLVLAARNEAGLDSNEGKAILDGLGISWSTVTGGQCRLLVEEFKAM